jgi:ABC-type Fe3+/spermidine/putrescine transport system ATPase subunit
MRGEIKRLHSETQTTALYVTHDQDEALSIADRIGIMRDGVLIQVGTPRELYRTPQSRFVSEFIGETNFIPATVKALDANEIVVETPLGVVRAAPRDELTIGQKVWLSIRPESWRVSEVDKAESSTRNDENRFTAHIQSVMYGGASEQLQAILNGGTETAEDEHWRRIKIALLNSSRPMRDNEAIALHVDKDDVVVLSE